MHSCAHQAQVIIRNWGMTRADRSSKSFEAATTGFTPACPANELRTVEQNEGAGKTPRKGSTGFIHVDSRDSTPRHGRCSPGGGEVRKSIRGEPLQRLRQIQARTVITGDCNGHCCTHLVRCLAAPVYTSLSACMHGYPRASSKLIFDQASGNTRHEKSNIVPTEIARRRNNGHQAKSVSTSKHDSKLASHVLSKSRARAHPLQSQTFLVRTPKCVHLHRNQTSPRKVQAFPDFQP